MKPTKATDYALGVMVTSRMVSAVLLQVEGNETNVIRRLVRHRVQRTQVPHHALAMAGNVSIQDSSDGDYTLHFGDGAGNNDLFLNSEFGVGKGDGKGSGEANSRAQTFEYELSEILDECERTIHVRPPVYFCLSSNEVMHIEVVAQEKSKKKTDGKAPAPTNKPSDKKRKFSNEQLLAFLSDQYQGEIDKERVSFFPMAPTDDGAPRYMALAAKANEPVGATLSLFRNQKDEPMPTVRLLDTEANLFVGMARMVYRASGAAGGDKKPHTLIVRAGSDDTLVMFVRGDELRHYENMRSLTAYDAPETICSRVLLQQDEYGIDDVHDILVLTEDRELDLIENFGLFFPDARVTSVRDLLPRQEGDLSGEQSGSLALATCVALRSIKDADLRNIFEEVNLLPRRYLRKKIELPFSIPTLILSVFLFVTAFFFAGRFVIMESKISDYNDRLKQYPSDIASADPRVLQARIDSLNASALAITHSLSVLDTLLIGSDRWSRGLEQLSREVDRHAGIWVEGWQPRDGMVVLSGNATSRDRVVELAERMNGEIQTLTFSEIREAPVYTFIMQIPLSNNLPQAAEYLRELAARNIEAAKTRTGSPPVTPASLNAKSR